MRIILENPEFQVQTSVKLLQLLDCGSNLRWGERETFHI